MRKSRCDNCQDERSLLQVSFASETSVSALGKPSMKCFVCRECFNAYFVHRFRATFGKVRLFTEGEKVKSEKASITA